MTAQNQQWVGVAMALGSCVGLVFAFMDNTVRTPQMALLFRANFWTLPMGILSGALIAWLGYQRRKKGE